MFLLRDVSSILRLRLIDFREEPFDSELKPAEEIWAKDEKLFHPPSKKKMIEPSVSSSNQESLTPPSSPKKGLRNKIFSFVPSFGDLLSKLKPLQSDTSKNPEEQEENDLRNEPGAEVEEEGNDIKDDETAIRRRRIFTNKLVLVFFLVLLMVFVLTYFSKSTSQYKDKEHAVSTGSCPSSHGLQLSCKSDEKETI